MGAYIIGSVQHHPVAWVVVLTAAIVAQAVYVVVRIRRAQKGA